MGERVSGTLAVKHGNTSMGSASYAMSGDVVEPYTEPSTDKPR